MVSMKIIDYSVLFSIMTFAAAHAAPAPDVSVVRSFNFPSLPIPAAPARVLPGDPSSAQLEITGTPNALVTVVVTFAETVLRGPGASLRVAGFEISPSPVVLDDEGRATFYVGGDLDAIPGTQNEGCYEGRTAVAVSYDRAPTAETNFLISACASRP